MTRTQLNLGTGDLDNLARITSAQREIKEIADELFHRKTSKRDDRQQLARRLNSVAVSLHTVELRLGDQS